MARIKTRNLSVAEYFLVLQREYLIADFKRKIYYSPKNKAYWARVCEYKKQRIESISSRNRLNSIFNSDEKMEELRDELFDLVGNPKFSMSESDIENYYSNGNEFSYKGEIYILDQVCEDDTLTLYSPNKEQFINVKKEEVVRIL